MLHAVTANHMSWEVRIDHGRVKVETPRRGVLIASFSGTCSHEHVIAATRLLDQWVDEGLEVIVGLDNSKLEEVTPTFRRDWSRWLKRNGRQVKRVEVLPRYRERADRSAGRVRRHATALSFSVAVAA